MSRHDPLANPGPLIGRVYAYVAYRIGPGPDAEDVTSEVFERAVRYRSSYDPKRGDPMAWLIGIARRSIDSRGQLPMPVPPDELDGGSADGPEQATLDRLRVTGAVSTLDERSRDLIALRYGADLSARQIASMMDMKPNAVDVALHRALAKLRIELDEQEGQTGRATLGAEPS
jgi:RNA polymerase sigma factor (sigma-70 family)